MLFFLFWFNFTLLHIDTFMDEDTNPHHNVHAYIEEPIFCLRVQ